MRRTAHLLLLALLLAACGGWRGGDRLMSRADSLMYARPDAALALLDSIPEADRARMSKGQRMRYELLRADAQNKNFVKFTTDSVLKAVVSYYDSHGTPNERMRANYLLGRAYYDMGETPLALKYYHEAADCADTTQIDCDYKLLSRVHGQMGRLFLDQGAPLNSIEEYKHAEFFAKSCRDTLLELYCMSNQGNAYIYLNMPDSAIKIKEYASELFKKYGYYRDAIAALAPLIDILVGRGQFSEAKTIIEKNESESGLFDENHNITPGREIFYYSKGHYYLGIHQYDSAAMFFKKLLANAKKNNHFECGYEGMSIVFHEQEKLDSAYLYALKAYAYRDSCHRENATEYFQRNHSLYNYSRQQQIAELKMVEAHQNELRWHKTIFASALILLFALYVIVALRNRNERLKLRQHILMGKISSLERTKSKLLKSKKDLANLLKLKETELLSAKGEVERTKISLSSDKKLIEKKEMYWQSLIDAKQNEIEEYQARIRVLESQIHAVPEKDMIQAIQNLPIVIDLKKRLYSKGSSKMTYNQWRQLQESIDSLIPSFFSSISLSLPKLRSDEIIILYLTRAYFSTGEIAVLTEDKSSSVSMKKARLMKRVFSCKGGAKEFEELVQTL